MPGNQSCPNFPGGVDRPHAGDDAPAGTTAGESADVGAVPASTDPSVGELVAEIQACLDRAHTPERDDRFADARNLDELSRAVARLSAKGPRQALGAALQSIASTLALLLTRLQAGMVGDLGRSDRRAIGGQTDQWLPLTSRMRESLADLDLLVTMAARTAEVLARMERCKAAVSACNEARTSSRNPQRRKVAADPPQDGGPETGPESSRLRLCKAAALAN